MKRINISLSDRSQRALVLAAELDAGTTVTDTVNRAIQAYSYLLHITGNGEKLLAQAPDGKTREIKFL